MLISSLILMIGCSNGTTESDTPSNSTNNLEPIIFKYNENEYKIVNFYQEFSQYIKEAENHPDNLDTLYIDTVLEPFTKSVFGEDYGEFISKQWGFGTPTRPKILEEYLLYLNENNNKINDLIIDALKKSTDELSSEDDKVVYILLASPDDVTKMKWLKGVTGMTWDQNVITIQIAPPFLDEDILKFVVAHEYQHAVFFEKNEIGTNATVLEEVMLEGKADTFAQIMYPEVVTPWNDFSTKSQEENTWSYLEKNLNSINASIKDDLFYGNSSKGILDTSNYKMGNKIMDSFIQENPSISIEEWTEMSADEILEKSKYEAKNQE